MIEERACQVRRWFDRLSLPTLACHFGTSKYVVRQDWMSDESYLIHSPIEIPADSEEVEDLHQANEAEAEAQTQKSPHGRCNTKEAAISLLL